MRGIMTAAVLALGLGTSGNALAQSLAWQVTEVSGTVTIRHGSEERAATRGATLAAGDIIATAAGGRAVMVHEKDFVTLAPRSRATVPGATEQASGFTKLLQDLGNAVYKIEKRGVPHFGVTTPYLAAVVKGTTFSITVDDRGSTLQVVEGAVEVATPDGGARDLILPAGVATIAAANPYRLTVHGDHERVIDSPAAPATGATESVPSAAKPTASTTPSSPSPETSSATENVQAVTATSGASPVATVAPVADPVVAVQSVVPVQPVAVVQPAVVADVIAVPVASRPVDMARFTGGLVSGTGGYTALTAAVGRAIKTETVAASGAAPHGPAGGPPAIAQVSATPVGAAKDSIPPAAAATSPAPPAAAALAAVAPTPAPTPATPTPPATPTGPGLAIAATPIATQPLPVIATPTPVAAAPASVVAITTPVVTSAAAASLVVPSALDDLDDNGGQKGNNGNHFGQTKGNNGKGKGG